MDGLLVVAGGGTGGHLYPGLAVAREARRRDPNQSILYVGRDDPGEKESVEREGFEFRGFKVRGLQRRRIYRNLFIVYEHLKAMLQMKGILSAAPRGAVLGMGGYASAAAVLAARLSRWPLILHEQNSYPGVVNRYFSRHAAAVCITFQESQPHFSGLRPELTGMPIRREVHPPEGWQRRTEPGDPPCILLLGGSQGARSLVTTMLDAARQMDESKISYRLILQTGIRNQDLVAGIPERPHVLTPAFLDDVASAYKVADILVCRAGAGTLAEAALWQLPALIVPLPTSAGNHQMTNARHFERVGAARILPQDELDGPRLVRAVQSILNNRSLWREMVAGMASQAQLEASQRVLGVIEQVAGGTYEAA
ncbi:MAG: undecaprenyldiphospho-muramoylpentapeptide beta-N-acetylglucosaminyltransferase [bacterium]